MSTIQTSSSTEVSPPSYEEDKTADSTKSQDHPRLYNTDENTIQYTPNPYRIRPVPPPFASDRDTDRPVRLLDPKFRVLVVLIFILIYLIVAVIVRGWAGYGSY